MARLVGEPDAAVGNSVLGVATVAVVGIGPAVTVAVGGIGPAVTVAVGTMDPAVAVAFALGVGVASEPFPPQPAVRDTRPTNRAMIDNNTRWFLILHPLAKMPTVESPRRNPLHLVGAQASARPLLWGTG